MSEVPTRSYVYFIAAGEFIKIGYSRSLRHRLHKLLTDVPDPELLWIEDGTVKQEKCFHRQFAHIRARGEWFHKTPELLAFIRQRHLLLRPDLALPPMLVETAQ
jgi:hypothetical protein